MPPYLGLNGKTRWRLHTMYSVQTLIFRQVVNLYVQGHLDLLSGVAPSYSSKESALHCY